MAEIKNIVNITVKKGDKLAVHYFHMGRLPLIVLGENPYSKSGSSNGKWLDGEPVFSASFNSKRMQNAVYQIQMAIKFADETSADQVVSLMMGKSVFLPKSSRVTY